MAEAAGAAGAVRAVGARELGAAAGCRARGGNV